MTEQTGALAQVVEAYFQGDIRTPSQQKILASYLHQYVSRAVLLPGIKRDLFLQKIARLRSQHEFESFADELCSGHRTFLICPSSLCGMTLMMMCRRQLHQTAFDTAYGCSVI